VSGRSFRAALSDLSRFFKSGHQGMIIGGIAVIALGYPRVTTDIDATMAVPLDALDDVLARFERFGFLPRIDDATGFARTSHVLLMKHAASGVPVDVSIAMLPFEEEAIRRKQVVEFEGIALDVPRVDDLVIYKMVASRPDDLRDVEELLLRYGSTIDLQRARALLQEFADVLERPDMVVQFDTLVRAARRSAGAGD
jgi:hypothetical protein